VKKDSSFVTLLYGEDVTEETASAIYQAVAPGCRTALSSR
jgi:tRNA threonylcarbamoyladenosine modification (KEOPS) complex  Pcc1 subunit